MSSNERLTLNYYRLNVGVPVLDSCKALVFLKPTKEVERQCSEVDAVCLSFSIICNGIEVTDPQ